MRNLLGRLHARPPAELTRIATFWQVPPASGDRPVQVGVIYRTLTDPRAVRAAWDRLDDDERSLVRLLAVETPEDQAPTLPALAEGLGVDVERTKQIAGRLYRVGILAREGDDEPLPVGELPRLFLPRELALLFRRVQDEIEAGDLDGTPLRALMELLDDAEIEEAAEIWGVSVVPGLRRRDDLVSQLLRRVADSKRVAAVAAALSADAARLWRRVRDEPDGQPVLLAIAAAEVGLDGDDPRLGQRLRRALAELETALLVWHSYHRDGSRWLFVPAEIRSPSPPATPQLPPLAPLIDVVPEPPPWHHPDALAWDLLTLLRDVSDPLAAPWPAGSDPPRPRLRRLNGGLWHRGDDVPPPGYLDFLVTLAAGEGLLRPDDEEKSHLVLDPSARRWRGQSFAQQTERLRRRWLDHPDWIEGRSRDEIDVWGADWGSARRKLLALVASPKIETEPGTWYALDSVAARLASLDPDLLGPTFTAATARSTPTAGGEDPESGRIAATATIVAVELVTALAWFGLVEVADVVGRTRAVRFRWMIPTTNPPSAPSDPPLETTAPRALVLKPGGEIELHRPTPLRVWALSAFADTERLGRVSVYRLTAAGLERALAAGFDLTQIITFLADQTETKVPDEIVERLRAWARGYRRVRAQDAVVLKPDASDALADLRRLATEAGLDPVPLPDGALLVGFPVDGFSADPPRERLLDLLREHGFAPHRLPAVPSSRHP